MNKLKGIQTIKTHISHHINNIWQILKNDSMFYNVFTITSPSIQLSDKQIGCSFALIRKTID